MRRWDRWLLCELHDQHVGVAREAWAASGGRCPVLAVVAYRDAPGMQEVVSVLDPSRRGPQLRALGRAMAAEGTCVAAVSCVAPARGERDVMTVVTAGPAGHALVGTVPVLRSTGGEAALGAATRRVDTAVPFVLESFYEGYRVVR
ncbi:MAG: hypothetical protein R3181_00100 [Rubricoccaceae bacterium]|nr:hypothetical protein [Rubricoccaceae bacterium]